MHSPMQPKVKGVLKDMQLILIRPVWWRMQLYEKNVRTLWERLIDEFNCLIGDADSQSSAVPHSSPPPEMSDSPIYILVFGLLISCVVNVQRQSFP